MSLFFHASKTHRNRSCVVALNWHCMLSPHLFQSTASRICSLRPVVLPRISYSEKDKFGYLLYFTVETVRLSATYLILCERIVATDCHAFHLQCSGTVPLGEGL